MNIKVQNWKRLLEILTEILTKIMTEILTDTESMNIMSCVFKAFCMY